jgi:hypothetical protein
MLGNHTDTNQSITKFNPECQRILERLPGESKALIINGLSNIQPPDEFTAEALLMMLQVVFGIEIKPENQEKVDQYHFPDSPLKSSLAKALHSDDPELSPEAMIIVVAALKRHYREKGITYNPIVIADSDLAGFFEYLKANHNTFPEDTRFQVLSFNKNNKHWSVMDIRIKNGIIEFYLLDAAYFSNREIILKIMKSCSDFRIKYSSGHIQSDLKHCAIFAIDHSVQMAKMKDFHGKLDAVKGYNLSTDPTIQFVPLDNMPPEFGVLMRNMQSLKKLSQLSRKISGLAGSKKAHLDDYLNSKNRKQEELIESVPVLRNMAIKIKRQIIKDRALQFLLSLNNDTECQNIINSMDHFKNQATDTEKPSPESSHHEILAKLSMGLFDDPILNSIYSLYGAFEIIEMLSFDLHFRCDDLFSVLIRKSESAIPCLLLISQNKEAFKRLYKGGQLSIEKVDSIDHEQLQTMLFLSSDSNQTKKRSAEPDNKESSKHQFFPKAPATIPDSSSRDHESKNREHTTKKMKTQQK